MLETALPFLPTAPTHKTSPDLLALFDDVSSDWVSYGELRTRINDIRSVFLSDDKKLILCCMPRTIDGVVAYLATAASEHALALVDTNIPHFDDIVKMYQPYWIIVPTGAGVAGYKPAKWNLSTLEVLETQKPEAGFIHPDLYLLLLTSGSTGSSKGVRLSYKNLASNTEAIIKSLGLTSESRALAHLPLSYSFGLSVLHAQLAVGSSCILTQHGMMSPEFWNLAKEHNATLFPGVPYHYEMLSKLNLKRINVPTLKTFLQAGGKMQEALARDIWQQVEAHQGELFVMYGQTEASPRMSCLALHKHPEKLGSCGQALEGGQFNIKDDEIIYIGPNVMMGYAESAVDLALGDVMGGRLATGDIGHLDETGYLTISGRKQRFAKLFGQRISLNDLERIGGTIDTVVAIELVEKIVLVSTTQDGFIRERIKEIVIAETKLSPTWLDVRSVVSIPHMANGKIDYASLREML